MKKAKKSATKRGRQKMDWALFLRLCRERRPNHEIAEKMGWKTDRKSQDKFQRVRAAKSILRVKGVKIDGRLTFLRDRKLKGMDKEKPGAKKKVTSNGKPKPHVAQPSPQTPAESKQGE